MENLIDYPGSMRLKLMELVGKCAEPVEDYKELFSRKCHLLPYLQFLAMHLCRVVLRGRRIKESCLAMLICPRDMVLACFKCQMVYISELLTC